MLPNNFVVDNRYIPSSDFKIKFDNFIMRSHPLKSFLRRQICGCVWIYLDNSLEKNKHSVARLLHVDVWLSFRESVVPANICA